MVVWWGFYATNDWTLPIDPAKNTKKGTTFMLGALVWCRPKTLGRENKYPYLKRTENTCVVFLVVIRSEPSSRWSCINT